MTMKQEAMLGDCCYAKDTEKCQCYFQVQLRLFLACFVVRAQDIQRQKEVQTKTMFPAPQACARIA